MKKAYIIVSIVILIVAGAYLYVRFGLLKSKDFKPDTSKSRSVLDLRPALIARLQQLVKDGSNGLYILSIGKLEPHPGDLSVDISDATFTPDSLVLAKLDADHKAPDDVLKLSFSSLQINGIGLQALLNNKQVEIETLHFIDPVVNIYHSKKSYNQGNSRKPDSVTLYRLIMKSISKIQIGAILIDNGTFINHNLKKKDNVTHIDNITVNMKDILVDSSTQYDTERFLFAKSTDVSLKNYSLRTADSLYFFKASSIDLSAIKHDLTAYNVELVPRGNRQEFERKLKHRKDMFTIKTRKVILRGVNFYDFVNDEKLIAAEGVIENCNFADFFDNSVPASTSSSPSLNDFPHQLLMAARLQVYIKKLTLDKLNITYEEFNPSVHRSGIVSFDGLNAQITNVTNMPEYIRKNNKTKIFATGLFMKQVNLQAEFLFDLVNYKKGEFAFGVTLGKMDPALLNPVLEPLAFVSVKTGMINKIVATINGNNFKGTGKLLLLYEDLNIDPLKKDNDGKLKKRRLTDFIANFLFVKNANPSKRKAARTVDCNYTRDPRSSFFNMVFKTILTGVLKTIGLPEKLAYK